MTTYDDTGNVILVTQSEDTVTCSTVPTENLVWTSYTYDGEGNVTQELSSSGAKTEYTYDDNGNVTDVYSYYDASDCSHKSYTYDNMDRALTESIVVQNRDITGYDNTTADLTLTTSYTYDLNGNVETMTDADNVTTTYTYDQMNQLLTTSQPGLDETGTPVTITTSKTYDWAGNVLTATDALGNVTTYAYDAQGNLSTVTDELDGVQYYEYDRAGRVTAEVSPENYDSGVALTSMTRTAYTYDEMGSCSA